MITPLEITDTLAETSSIETKRCEECDVKPFYEYLDYNLSLHCNCNIYHMISMDDILGKMCQSTLSKVLTNNLNKLTRKE